MQTKLQKKSLIKDWSEKIKTAKAVVFADFKGFPVKEMMALRKELRKAGVEMKVLKKTLMRLALKEAGVEMDVRKMEGQISLAVSPKDEIAAAKIIFQAAKANENLKITGGLLGRKEMSVPEINAMAILPSKEELLAKLTGSLNAPLSGLVNVLAGNLRGLVQTLRAIGEGKN
ncbi:MAG: 50S ribosomal protein L10 [Candidatus Moranbacteria bacterium CG_4_9_14_3_um_filter_40_7]|nr:MAG: 50S ribosomal protein L10 [Candidatus Moranbacteria bacterium CG23_combo_of_CG06-09_8_20_14_all_40_16]PIU80755.1 MAG: 50S ribosomal protein L10 [Candidatus Moranbacteria bacterium CG06_land_8_20_14_3_00_40_12]PJA87806.1 MAG: 50S ribosomal protein L10 [Candidatus Moranbacteria bacterium CG_4_9_14_3_um_filter_40_7]